MHHRARLLPAALVLLAVLAAAASAAVVVEYRFEGNAQDTSGNNQHGNLMNGATFAPGLFGQALSLDGINDYVAVPISNYTFTNFTMECWVNVPTYGTNLHYISLHRNAYLVLGDYSSGVISTWADGLSPIQVNGAAPGLTVNQWHHFAFTYDGANQIVYVDGAPVTTTPTSGAVNHNPGSFPDGLNIGARYTGSLQFVSGLMDNVRLHDVALPANQLGFFRDQGPHILTVTAAPTQVAPGQTGIAVSMDVENVSPSSAFDVTTAGLTFEDSLANPVPGDYTVTPDPGNPTVIGAGATVTFDFMVDVALAATVDTITLDGVLDALEQGTGRVVNVVGADTPDSWDVVGAEPKVRVVDAAPDEVGQGGTGYPVTVSVENTGLLEMTVGTVSLSFQGVVDRTPEYVVTPDPGNPTVIAVGATESFLLLVDVSPAASLEVITIDAAIDGTTTLTGAAVVDPDADTTDTWTVVPCSAPVCGDCDGDTFVTILDALLAAQNSALVITLTGQAFSNCNVIGTLQPDPGAVVDILDALTLAQYAASVPVTLACC